MIPGDELTVSLLLRGLAEGCSWSCWPQGTPERGCRETSSDPIHTLDKICARHSIFFTDASYPPPPPLGQYPPELATAPSNPREERSPNDRHPPFPEGDHARGPTPDPSTTTRCNRGKVFFGAVDCWGK